MQQKFRVPDDVWNAFCASLPANESPSDRLRKLVQMQVSPLDYVMGTEEASERWGLSQDHIKRLCRDGKVNCILIGKTWVLDKNQPNPSQK